MSGGMYALVPSGFTLILGVIQVFFVRETAVVERYKMKAGHIGPGRRELTLPHELRYRRMCTQERDYRKLSALCSTYKCWTNENRP